MPDFTGFGSTNVDDVTIKIDSEGKLKVKAVGQAFIFLNPRQYKSIVQGTWAYTRDENYYGDYVWNNGTTKALNDEVDYRIWLPEGTFKLYFIYKKGSNGGIMHALLDDTEQGTIDTYAGSAAYNQSDYIELTTTEAGFYDLKIKMASKNASASDYMCNIAFMYITE